MWVVCYVIIRPLRSTDGYNTRSARGSFLWAKQFTERNLEIQAGCKNFSVNFVDRRYAAGCFRNKLKFIHIFMKGGKMSQFLVKGYGIFFSNNGFNMFHQNFDGGRSSAKKVLLLVLHSNRACFKILRRLQAAAELP